MIDSKFIVKLQGKDFITHAGLLDAFHKLGGQSIETELIRNDVMIVFKATVRGDKGFFTGHGDADDSNVNSMIAKHKLRMAETRAINRALRFYTNIGMCSADELGGEKADIIVVDKPSIAGKKKEKLETQCEVCGSLINSEVVDYCKRNFKGISMCRSCQEEEKKNDSV